MPDGKQGIKTLSFVPQRESQELHLQKKSMSQILSYPPQADEPNRNAWFFS